MLKMSFYDGTLNVEEAIKYIKASNKPLKYRYGFGWKGAEMHDISQENGIKALLNDGWSDVDETEDYILINQYSEGDMF